MILTELTKVKIQPSDIGKLIAVNIPIVLEFNDKETVRTNSTYVIDRMINGEYDDYEVTKISVENYGWLRIDLNKFYD